MPDITVCIDEPIGSINPNLYGHFAEHLGTCIYEGIWVGEDSPIPNTEGIRNDVVEALRRISPPVVRWPGGNFADDYHWEDGVGPRSARPRRVNIWWDAIEPNTFGTHEFVRFCRLIGAEPYICGNVGSGHPRELRNWIEYCNYPSGTTLSDLRKAHGAPEPFGVRYWGVGNENWAAGGFFSPEDYASEYRRFATYLRDFGGTPLFLVACGPGGNDPEWSHGFFQRLHGYKRFGIPPLSGYAAHYYCGTAGTSTEYTPDEWYQLLHRAAGVDALIVQQRAIMDGYDPERKVGLIIDEWGAWHRPEAERNPAHLWQQNTLRDALVAAITLDTFNRHADKVVMGNIAQTINVLQAMVLTDGERMLVTPTYHVYDMYQAHQGGQSVRALFDDDEISFAGDEGERRLARLSGSASVKDDRVTLSVVNASVNSEAEVMIRLRGGSAESANARVLTHADIRAHNTFDAPHTLSPRSAEVESQRDGIHCTLPPASVSTLSIALST